MCLPDWIKAMHDCDDNSLIQAISEQRDHAAFAELFERYKHPGFSLAFSLLNDSELAEDAFQEAMVSVWRSAKFFSAEKGSVKKWIWGTVANKCLTISRSSRRYAKRLERTTAMKQKDVSNDASVAENDEVLEALRQCISTLPELDRKLLTCHFGAELPHEKIGELLSIPRSTVTRKIQDALAQLRSRLALSGFAAAVPLLCPETLHTAILSNCECPSGMSDRMLQRIREVNGARSIRGASVRSWAWPGVYATVAAVCVVTGVLFWRMTAQKSTAAGGVEALPVSERAGRQDSAARTPYARTWNFNTESSFKDIVVTGGAIHWTADGHLETSEEGAKLSINIPESSNSLYAVSLNLQQKKPSREFGFHMIARWESWSNSGGVRIRGFAHPPAYEGKQLCMRAYVSPTTVAYSINNEPINSVYLYDRESGSSPFTITIIGLQQIENLTIREIRPDESPDIGQFKSAIDKIAPFKRVGTVELPELKPAVKGQPVTAMFFPPLTNHDGEGVK